MPPKDNRVLRVGCTGSAGGGKTSLISHLVPYCPGAHTITYSRPTKAANLLGYANASEVPPGRALIYQHFGLMEQIHAEREMTDRGRPFLSDRTILDFAAYYMYRLKPSRDAVPFFEIALTWLDTKPYDLIVLVPPNSKGTEYRDTRLMHGVQEVHDLIEMLIEEWNLEDLVLRLKTDTALERAYEVHVKLKAMGILAQEPASSRTDIPS